MHTRKAIGIAFAMLLGLGVGLVRAEAPSFKRVELQRHDLGVSGREAMVARGEFQPGAVAPRHSHPGEEIGYVLDGELSLELDGQPPKTLKAGDPFFIAAGQVHGAKAGPKGATVLSTYILEKGKPLATPAK